MAKNVAIIRLVFEHFGLIFFPFLIIKFSNLDCFKFEGMIFYMKQQILLLYVERKAQLDPNQVNYK